MYIEVKRQTGVLFEIQKLRIKELRAQNINVKIWTDYEHDFNWNDSTELEF